MVNLIPTKINAQKQDQIVVVEWNDGHVSHYPFQLLRAGCPCVECRGGHDQMTADPSEDVFDVQIQDSAAIHLVNLALVGSYGMNFQWEDGHQEGIFHWDYLRKLCPCDLCRRGTK
jgi:DUF971 family protein